MSAPATHNLVVVSTRYYRPDPRYTLHVAEGDTVWSFDCTHLHQTAYSARKCRARLGRCWANYAGSARAPIAPGPAGLVELTHRNGSTTKRMRPLVEPEVVG
jgi:hypothetical protein